TREPSEGSDKTEPFKEDETAVTPPPPRHRRARISIKPQTPMAASTQALIDAFAARSSLFPLPPTSPAYDQALLGEFPEIDPYEKVSQQGQVYPLLPTYVPNLMELDEHMPVHVPKPEHPEYPAPLDDDI
nr:hypothetical protein [Tanacetum cinerariifolium]